MEPHWRWWAKLSCLLVYVQPTIHCVHNLTVDCILGTDCLRKHGAVMDCKRLCVTMSRVELLILVQAEQSGDNKPVVNLISDTGKVIKTLVIAGRTVQPLEVLLPVEVATLEECSVLIEHQSGNVPNHLLSPTFLSAQSQDWWPCSNSSC